MPTKAWVEANREHLRKYRREWMRANREKVQKHVDAMRAKDPEGWKEGQRERSAKSRKKNPEKMKEKYREYYNARRKRDPEAVQKNQRDSTRRYRENNPDGKKANDHKRRARKLNAPGLRSPMRVLRRDETVDDGSPRPTRKGWGSRCNQHRASLPVM